VGPIGGGELGDIPGTFQGTFQQFRSAPNTSKPFVAAAVQRAFKGEGVVHGLEGRIRCMLRTFGRPRTHRRGRSCRQWRRSHPTLDHACLGAACSQASSTCWPPAHTSTFHANHQGGKTPKGQGSTFARPKWGCCWPRVTTVAQAKATRRAPIEL
jgi:hypothetical protein